MHYSRHSLEVKFTTVINMCHHCSRPSLLYLLIVVVVVVVVVIVVAVGGGGGGGGRRRLCRP